MEELFVQVTRRAEGKRPKLTASGWSEVLQDLFELRRLIPVVGVDACIEILCESLLCSEEDNLHLVRDIFNYRPADALFKTKSALLYVLSVHKVALVALKSKEKSVSAACEFFLDSSKVRRSICPSRHSRVKKKVSFIWLLFLGSRRP